MLLAGDIGATKTNLGIYSPEKGAREPLVESTFPSPEYPSLETLAREFLDSADVTVDSASFGVAGPVIKGQAKTTNLPWVIDEVQLRKTLHLNSVRLLNDLEAIAYGVPIVGPEDLHTLNEGAAILGGTLAIIAPGTGLGEAFLTWNRTRYQAHASEGGHADFGPTSPIELDLLQYLHDKFGHVSYERICSGQGLPNIYAFLKDRGYAVEQDWLAEQLKAGDDPTPVIVNAALDKERPCELCIAAIRLFVSVLGAEAGNLALKVLATGGVYLGGGIPPHIIPALEDKDFMESFTGKGRFSELLSRIPVHVIMNPKIALIGAAYYGLELLQQSQRT
ncbi:MAG: glucokinase [Deltaproteobacteria bacterium]|nr:MAG: glucokinase [Deltaproteobacteria bacterium]